MDFTIQKNALKLIYSMTNKKKQTVPCIEYVPQKGDFDSVCGTSFQLAAPGDSKANKLRRTSPEKQGVSSEHIYNFIKELSETEEVRMHSVMIARGGCVIGEASIYPYDSELWHITYSACKTITGLAIGMLIDDGLLTIDMPIHKIFEKKLPLNGLLAKKNITVKHLLIMSSGVGFSEPGSVTETDWIKGFFESSSKFEPGKEFSYNSMNSYILSAIVKEITGVNMNDFLKERLWRPLGIEDVFWECCPKGIEKGGWGLYMTIESILKVGILILQGGMWNGKSIISKDWIRNASSKQIDVPDYVGKYDYGYQMWVGSSPNVCMLNGMFGQNTLIFPDTNTVVTINAGNEDMFQKNAFFSIAEKYFGDDFRPSETRLDRNLHAYRKLVSLRNSLQNKSPIQKIRRITSISAGVPDECRAFCDKTYFIQENDGAGIGLLPLFVQGVQNNFTPGISKVGFCIKEDVFYIIVTEGEDVYEIPVGFGSSIYTKIYVRKEPYYIAATGVFTKNEDDIPCFKISIPFIETASVRCIKIFYKEKKTDKLDMVWLETPGCEFIKNGIISVRDSLKEKKLLNKIASKTDTDYLEYRINSVLLCHVPASLEERSGEDDRDN